MAVNRRDMLRFRAATLAQGCPMTNNPAILGPALHAPAQTQVKSRRLNAATAAIPELTAAHRNPWEPARFRRARLLRHLSLGAPRFANN